MYVWQYLHTLKHRDAFDLAVLLAETDPYTKNMLSKST